MNEFGSNDAPIPETKSGTPGGEATPPASVPTECGAGPASVPPLQMGKDLDPEDLQNPNDKVLREGFEEWLGSAYEVVQDHAEQAAGVGSGAPFQVSLDGKPVAQSVETQAEVSMPRPDLPGPYHLPSDAAFEDATLGATLIAVKAIDEAKKFLKKKS